MLVVRFHLDVPMRDSAPRVNAGSLSAPPQPRPGRPPFLWGAHRCHRCSPAAGPARQREVTSNRASWHQCSRGDGPAKGRAPRPPLWALCVQAKAGLADGFTRHRYQTRHLSVPAPKPRSHEATVGRMSGRVPASRKEAEGRGHLASGASSSVLKD